jgi:hypothetical protein
MVSLAYCNDELSTCFINNKYRLNDQDKKCFIIKVYESITNTIFKGPDFENNQNCYEILNGSVEYVKNFFNNSTKITSWCCIAE